MKRIFFPTRFANNRSQKTSFLLVVVLAFIASFSTPLTAKNSGHLEVEGNCLMHVNTPFLPNADSTGCTCHIWTGTELCMADLVCPPFSEKIKAWDIQVSPSPISDFFSLSIDGGMDPKLIRVQILDRNHQVILDAGEMGTRNVRFSTENLPTGYYLLQLSLADEPFLLRSIKVYKQ